MVVRGKELKEGLYLKASINTGRSANAIEIDRNMLIDGKAIFAVNRDSALRLLPVEVISYSEDKAIVEKVPSGTWIPKVQVNGAFEGMKVIPQLSK
jgi:membrane fusion protein (multidrug efflux system)